MPGWVVKMEKGQYVQGITPRGALWIGFQQGNAIKFADQASAVAMAQFAGGYVVRLVPKARRSTSSPNASSPEAPPSPDDRS